MYGRYLKGYKRTHSEATVAVAEPHRIVQMMYEGLLERLAQAKGAIERNDFRYKADRISKAVGIINGLQGCLDPKFDPLLSSRLSALYDYMKTKLSDAANNMATEPIDEVIKLVLPIKNAWDKIPQDVRDQINHEVLENQKLAAKQA